MNNFYDFIIIGAGISACTFASCINKRYPDASLLLIEHGRRLGGRATTRKSRKNQILEFDHGLPSISFSKHVSEDILSLISPLINKEKLIDISNNILIMDEFGVLNNSTSRNKIYKSSPYMINFCEEIVNQSINPEKINFLFQTLTKSLYRNKDLWNVQINNGDFVKSKILIMSSSLIAHPRCLEILGIDTLPLRDAFIIGQDQVVDSLLQEAKKLTYIKRKIFILYVSNHNVVYNFNYKYLQVIFSEEIMEDLSFEKIIFQSQSDGSMILALHCTHIDKFFDIKSDNIIKSLKSLFKDYPIFIDLILEACLIDTMDWRASQPLNNLLSKELQWSETSKIGFCGDWFNWKNCGGVESAMNSSIRLAQLIH